MSANGSGEIGGGTGGVKSFVANFRDARPEFADLVYWDGGFGRLVRVARVKRACLGDKRRIRGDKRAQLYFKIYAKGQTDCRLRDAPEFRREEERPRTPAGVS